MTLAKAEERLGTKNLLPQGWRWVRLGDVCELSKGRTPREEWYSTSGVWLVRFRDVSSSGVNWIAGFRTFVDETYSGELKELKLGTVLVTADAHDPKSIGKKICLISSIPPHASPTYYSGELLGIMPKSGGELVPEMVLYWLQSEDGYQEIQEYVDGVHLNVGRAKDMKIPLPLTLAEQERIARILNEQMSAVEKARVAAEARLEAARALPAAYLRAAFSSEEVKVWSRQRLGDVCEITAKQVDPKIPEFAALPHVNGENIETGTCRITYLKTAGELGMISGKYIFDPGDVLYSKLRPYLRKVSVVDFRGVCSADMYPITVNKKVLNPHFLAWILVSDEFSDYADRESRRARMPKLNRDQLLSWNIPLPPISIQCDIVNKLSGELIGIERLVTIIQQEFETINALPAALLRRAFAGGL